MSWVVFLLFRDSLTHLYRRFWPDGLMGLPLLKGGFGRVPQFRDTLDTPANMESIHGVNTRNHVEALGLLLLPHVLLNSEQLKIPRPTICGVHN